MKKIKKIVLKEARTLSDEEMMHLFGGSSAPTKPEEGEEESGKTCYCVLISKTGYRTPAPVIMKNPGIESCTSGCTETCTDLPDLCERIEVSYY